MYTLTGHALTTGHPITATGPTFADAWAAFRNQETLLAALLDPEQPANTP